MLSLWNATTFDEGQVKENEVDTGNNTRNSQLRYEFWSVAELDRFGKFMCDEGNLLLPALWQDLQAGYAGHHELQVCLYS